jgi:hypothetical protein
MREPVMVIVWPSPDSPCAPAVATSPDSTSGSLSSDSGQSVPGVLSFSTQGVS